MSSLPASALRLGLVWLVLLMLLALTVGASLVLTGPESLAAGLGIACAKAVLIYWFFMGLRRENGLLRLFAVGAGAWLLILGLLTATDYATRF
ncbi:cytochrome C oxidase subunit IV family protein [Xanthobacter sp. VTT E-85241]|uniref:cytochrome C oxidase subunit IV family protein n=1 Tax=Roseixanthobacter finlandensis TaxID=3119922 RepID=UPI00372A583A